MDRIIRREQSQFLLAIDSIAQCEKVIQQHHHINTNKAVAFIGRSNVGKSSLINALFKNQLAKVSKTPGRTRTINVFSFAIDDDTFFLYDLPGYGHAKVSKEMSAHWDQLMHTFFQNLNDQVFLYVIMDARHPMQKADIDFLNYIARYRLNLFVLLNKSDRLKNQKGKNQARQVVQNLKKNHSLILDVMTCSIHEQESLKRVAQSVISNMSN